MIKENHIQPIILSGGSGTRLWPLSRKSLPKQYIHLTSLDKYSPLQETHKRLLGIRNLEDPIIICNEDQRFIAAEQMREIKIHPKAVLFEILSIKIFSSSIKEPSAVMMYPLGGSILINFFPEIIFLISILKLI